VNDAPTSEAIDITYRYRVGYKRLSGKGFDVILFIENDDYYHPHYIQMMCEAWEKHGRPQLLGTGSTIYYHIGLLKHVTMMHRSRASAMNTLIVPDMNLKWCADSEPYTDMWLWMREDVNNIRRVVFNPDKVYSLGIKHGEGKCGGSNHVTRLHRYKDSDENMNYLRSVVDQESFNFYEKLHHDLRSQKSFA
jgi:glycosyltransferase involved in cell wall biosynthesis